MDETVKKLTLFRKIALRNSRGLNFLMYVVTDLKKATLKPEGISYTAKMEASGKSVLIMAISVAKGAPFSGEYTLQTYYHKLQTFLDF